MHPESEIVKALKAGGYLNADAAPELTPLTGGVSSDVFRMALPGGPVCVKRAIPALRVAADWRAPVERSHYEVEWLKVARGLVGEAVPEVIFEAAEAHLFVMSFYEPADHPVWKSELAAGRIDPTVAGRVGRMLAAVHAGAAGREEIAGRFPTDDLFEALRLEPYLRATAAAHPDLAGRLTALADRTAKTRLTLVHGDVSPKNILVGSGGPVLLDAECAWWGDPAFDLAFCSTHLLLKTVWKPTHAAGFMRAYAELQGAYLAGIDWEAAEDLEARAAALTAALVLARVDGKSPVEYLRTDDEKCFVREAARRLILADHATMGDLAIAWAEGLGDR